jgi:hypothetical protein
MGHFSPILLSITDRGLSRRWTWSASGDKREKLKAVHPVYLSKHITLTLYSISAQKTPKLRLPLEFSIKLWEFLLPKIMKLNLLKFLTVGKI